MSYRIREVDGDDEHEALTRLHKKTFAGDAPMPNFSEGFWWLAFFEEHPVAFLGLVRSTEWPNTGYFYRVGVEPKHRGNKLQQRLMRAMHARARKLGWLRIVTDTRDSPHSANNIATAGYKMFTPTKYWTKASAQYWTKDL